MNAAAQYLRLVDALRLLPGVKPASERNRLGEAKYWATRSPEGIATWNGIRVTLAELEQLFIPDAQSRPCVSPAGAKLLLDLYRRDAFELLDGRKASGDLDLLTRYANGEAVPMSELRPPHSGRKAKPKSETLAAAPVAPKREPISSPALERNPAVTIHRPR